MNPAVESLGKFKKIILIITAILIIVMVLSFISQQAKNLRINLADKRYFRQYIKIEKYVFKKNNADNQATLTLIVENLGKRIIDSLPLEINYYNQKGKFLGKDNEDVLKFTKDILLPNKRKIFDIIVSCPQDSVDVKLKIKK